MTVAELIAALNQYPEWWPITSRDQWLESVGTSTAGTETDEAGQSKPVNSVELYFLDYEE